MNSRTSLLCLLLLVLTTRCIVAQQTSAAMSIHDLFEQDQLDQGINFDALPPAEQKRVDALYPVREQRVIELMQTGGIRTPKDLFEAGVVLTHSHIPEHQLLAHLTFTAAAFEGILEAKHLAATSLDRYLLFSHQTSIFGTTFQVPYQGWQHIVSPDMNDSIRAAFCIPPLKRLDEMFQQDKKGTPAPDTGHDRFWDVNQKGCK